MQKPERVFLTPAFIVMTLPFLHRMVFWLAFNIKKGSKSPLLTLTRFSIIRNQEKSRFFQTDAAGESDDEKKGDRNHRLPKKKSQLDPLKLGNRNPEALLKIPVDFIAE